MASGQQQQHSNPFEPPTAAMSALSLSQQQQQQQQQAPPFPVLGGNDAAMRRYIEQREDEVAGLNDEIRRRDLQNFELWSKNENLHDALIATQTEAALAHQANKALNQQLLAQQRLREAAEKAVSVCLGRAKNSDKFDALKALEAELWRSRPQ